MPVRDAHRRFGGWRAGRRSLLGAAAGTVAGSLLTGCSGVLGSAMRVLSPPRLRVGLVGFPTAVGSQLGMALQACAKLYAQQAGGPMTLQVQTEQIPEMYWYTHASPATVPQAPATSSTGLFESGTNTTTLVAQLPISGGIVVSGRTALFVPFGAPPPAVQPAPRWHLRASAPDLALAYTTWQSWLVPLAQPLAHAANTYAAHLAGVAPNVMSFGDFLPAGGALAPMGLPLLRNPMGLFFSSGVDAAARHANPSWTWEGMIRWLRGSGAHVATGSFLRLAAFPEGTESALAALAAYGGAVGQVRQGKVAETFADGASSPGLKAWSSIVHSGLTQWGGEGTPKNGVVIPGSYMVPQYLWSPLWGDREQWNPTWNAYPLPAGPRGRRAPCAYLCAFVTLGNTAGPLAEDFAAFLWSRGAQAALAGSSVGLPLRPEQALDAVAQRYPWLKSPAAFVDPGIDLGLADLYGDLSGLKDDTSLVAASDGFTARLALLQSSVNTANILG